MKDFINNIIANVNEPKAVTSQENLTLIKKNENMELKIIANEINIDRTNKDKVFITGNLLLFIAIP